MIIDFHTHIYPPRFEERREDLARRDATFATLFSSPRSRLATADELVAVMDNEGVDLAVVMGVGWTDRELAAEANDYIVASVERFPARLVGLCSVSPSWGEDAVREVERCARGGLVGIGELHPDTQGFDLTSTETMGPVMEAARELGLLVLTHSSEPVGHLYPGKGKTTPDKLYAFARNYPDNAIVCAHWGGGLPFYRLMPEVERQLTNVYYDTAASPLLYRPEIFSTIVSLGGSDKVLFGTDFPLVRPSRVRSQIENASIESEARADIMGCTARKLLGL